MANAILDGKFVDKYVPDLSQEFMDTFKNYMIKNFPDLYTLSALNWERTFNVFLNENPKYTN